MNQLSISEIKDQIKEQKITFLKKNIFSILIEEKLKKNINPNSPLENYLCIPNMVLDNSFSTLFNSNENLSSNNINDDLYCLFTSPLSDSWKEILLFKPENSFIFRSGFYSQEYEIYDSILNGFDGLFIFCNDQDKYEIQLLTEIARDYLFTLIFVVSNKKQLNTVLETDAPYIAISSLNPITLKQEIQNLIQLANLVPKTATLMAWTKKIDKNEKKLLSQLGYEVFFESH